MTPYYKTDGTPIYRGHNENKGVQASAPFPTMKAADDLLISAEQSSQDILLYRNRDPLVAYEISDLAYVQRDAQAIVMSMYMTRKSTKAVRLIKLNTDLTRLHDRRFGLSKVLAWRHQIDFERLGNAKTALARTGLYSEMIAALADLGAFEIDTTPCQEIGDIEALLDDVLRPFDMRVDRCIHLHDLFGVTGKIEAGARCVIHKLTPLGFVVSNGSEFRDQLAWQMISENEFQHMVQDLRQHTSAATMPQDLLIERMIAARFTLDSKQTVKREPKDSMVAAVT